MCYFEGKKNTRKGTVYILGFMTVWPVCSDRCYFVSTDRHDLHTFVWLHHLSIPLLAQLSIKHRYWHTHSYAWQLKKHFWFKFNLFQDYIFLRFHNLVVCPYLFPNKITLILIFDCKRETFCWFNCGLKGIYLPISLVSPQCVQMNGVWLLLCGISLLWKITQNTRFIWQANHSMLTR